MTVVTNRSRGIGEELIDWPAIGARTDNRRDRTVVMTEPPDVRLADRCLARATADVESWLALVDRGQLAMLAPFGQMFVYQLEKQGKLADIAFAIDALYRLYYRKADGKGEPPSQGDAAKSAG